MSVRAAQSPLELARDLIRFPSVSSASNGPICDYLSNRLHELGFQVERLSYEREGVTKHCLVGKLGSGVGGIAYAGHMDVVPADDWDGPGASGFDPSCREDRLYGRGSCDMKGSIACFLTAIEGRGPRHGREPVYMVLTADEETGQQGAAEVAARSQLFAEMVQGGTRLIIGEPTSLSVVYAHKGTCLFRVESIGEAAHSGGREGKNANLAMIPFLESARRLHDETENSPEWFDPRFDPPTLSLNIGINDHTAAVNIKPARSVATVFFRPMPGQTAGRVIEHLRVAAESQGLSWEVSRQEAPFLGPTDSPFVLDLVELTSTGPPRTINFGTDASRLRGIAETVILGPGSIAQAHTTREYITLDQLYRGAELYGQIVDRWCF